MYSVIFTDHKRFARISLVPQFPYLANHADHSFVLLLQFFWLAISRSMPSFFLKFKLKKSFSYAAAEILGPFQMRSKTREMDDF